MSTFSFDTSGLRPVGTQFVRVGTKRKDVHTIVGYRVVHDTDTGETKITYRCSHQFMGQTLTNDFPPVTIERGLAR